MRKVVHTELMHEFGFLYPEIMEMCFVFVCFGIEYVINLVGPEIEGYKKWLKKNDNKSPLYL